MNFLFFILAVVSATSYEKLLKQGERHFTSNDLRKGTQTQEGVSYDITLVKGYHSLDHDNTIDGVLCDKDTVTLFTKTPIKEWTKGDVFTGKSNWGCGDGISKKVESMKYVSEGNGRWKYEIKTTEAQLEDLFETATIEFKLPENHQTEEIVNGQKPLRSANTYSKTFTFDKTYTIVSKRAFTSTLSGKVEIPVTINGITVTVDSNKNTKTYSMSVHSGMTYDLKWVNSIEKSVSGKVEKKLYEQTLVNIPLLIGPIEVTIKLKPILRGSIDYSFNGAASATLSYAKTYTASMEFNSEADPILKASATDKTPDAKPKLTTNASMNGKCIPEVACDLEMKVNVYGINVLTGTPTLRVNVNGQLNGRKATIKPNLIFDYSVKLLIWSTKGSYTIVDGKTHTITF